MAPTHQPLPDSPVETDPLQGERTFSGRKAVLGMFGFAACMTAILFIYWELYTAPFRPVQDAIARAYPGSSPRAVGGKVKSHLPDSPRMLRLIVRIPWDPREDDSKARAMANHLASIAAKEMDLSQYDRLELFLMHRRPEKFTITWALDAPFKSFPIHETGPLPDEVESRAFEGVEGS